MAIQNAGWYNQNSRRRYPLHDAATALDDQGRALEDALLLDLTLSLPYELGPYVFLGGLHVQALPDGAGILVSLLLLGADSPLERGRYREVAQLQARGRLVSYGTFSLEGSQPHVSGSVVLGPALEQAREAPLRFAASSPTQSLLAPRTVRLLHGTARHQVAGLGKEGLVPLTGRVQLVAGPDLSLQVEEITLGGITQPALILGLQSAAPGRDVQALYAGPCAGRPESRSCPVPALEDINGIAPDCAGNLTLTFQGLTTYPVAHGLLLEHGTALSDLCRKEHHLSNVQGQLPFHQEDPCTSEYTGSSYVPQAYQPHVPEVILSESLPDGVPCPELPESSTLEDPDLLGLQVVAGRFEVLALEEATYQSQDLLGRNVSVLALCPPADLRGLTVSVELWLLEDAEQLGERAGGLVLGYQLESRGQYHELDVDLVRRALRLRYYNGARWSFLVATAPCEVRAGLWYRLTAQLGPTSPVTLTASLQRLDTLEEPGAILASLTTSLSSFLPTASLLGLGAPRSQVRFRNWNLQES